MAESAPGHGRIRIRLPNGSELEAAGTQEFVRAERTEFMASQGGIAGASASPAERGGAAHPQARSMPRPDWDRIIEAKESGAIQLRAKLKDDGTGKDACLVILFAAGQLLNLSKPTAFQLARWLRASGYPVRRVDRAISSGMDKGELLASGSRRARRYELTGPGRARAYVLAQQQSSLLG